MSNEDSSVNVDETDKGKSSGEGVLILSVVLGLSLSILIILRMLIRHWKTVENKLVEMKESIKSSPNKERVSFTRPTGRNYYVPKSLSNGPLVFISEREMSSTRGKEDARYLVNPMNSSKYFHYRNPDDMKYLQQELEWRGIQSDGPSSVIYKPSNVIWAKYRLPYDESSSSDSGSTDFTSSSVEKIDGFWDYARMYEVQSMQKQYNHFNYTLDRSSDLDYPIIRESQNTSNSASKIPLSLSNVDRNIDTLRTRNKWMYKDQEAVSSSSTSSDYTSAEVISSNSGMEREMKGSRYIFAESQTDRDRSDTVRVHTPPRNEKCDNTRFFESTESSSCKFQRDAGERDVFETHENHQVRNHKIRIVYGSEDLRVNTRGFGGEEKTTLRGAYNGEMRTMVTSQGEHDEATSTSMITDDEAIIKRRSQIYQGHRNSVEITPV